MDISPQRQRVYHQLMHWWGEADAIITFDGTATARPSAFASMDVAVWRARERGNVTIFNTMGMSDRRMPGADHLVELNLGCRRKLKEPDERGLATLLANITEYPFANNAKLDWWERLVEWPRTASTRSRDIWTANGSTSFRRRPAEDDSIHRVSETRRRTAFRASKRPVSGQPVNWGLATVDGVRHDPGARAGRACRGRPDAGRAASRKPRRFRKGQVWGTSSAPGGSLPSARRRVKVRQTRRAESARDTMRHLGCAHTRGDQSGQKQ
jgi:hypothetical protein